MCVNESKMLPTLVNSDPVGIIVAEGADGDDEEGEVANDGCSKVGGLELSSDVGDDVDDMIASYFKCGSYDEAAIMSLVAFSLSTQGIRLTLGRELNCVISKTNQKNNESLSAIDVYINILEFA